MPDPSSHTLSAIEAAQAAQASAESSADALKVSELQYRRLFEAARDGILILDSKYGKITDANPFMIELLGYSRDELIGKEVWQIGLLKDKAAGQEAFRRLKKDGYIRYENLPLENRQGELRQVEFVSNLYREDGHTVIQCNIRDITERKRVEAQLADTAAKHGYQTAVMEERTRLAHEIHDTLAQGFIGITTQLEAADAALAKALEPNAPDNITTLRNQLEKVQGRIEKSRELARESLAEARRSVADLRSLPLEATPLSEALGRFLNQAVLGTAAKSRYVLEGAPYTLAAGTEHCLLRIGQAAITNAVQHAQAHGIDVILSFEAGQVRLRVQDDGQGFDPLHLGEGRFGIIGMRERAEKVIGKLTIVSRPGAGTKVGLTIPMSTQGPVN